MRKGVSEVIFDASLFAILGVFVDLVYSIVRVPLCIQHARAPEVCMWVLFVGEAMYLHGREILPICVDPVVDRPVRGRLYSYGPPYPPLQ